MKFYHVTKKDNFDSIMEFGLIPKIGELSAQLGEPSPAIYLFHSESDVMEALMNWFGEQFDDDDELVLLEVNNLPVEVEILGFEAICKSIIPSRCIKFLREV